MEDREIVALYWARSERAIAETQKKYGAYLMHIALRILPSREDAEECVSDGYHGAWNAMPPHRPAALSAFLGKLVRRSAIDRFRRGRAEKRGGGELPLALEELGECVGGGAEIEDELERRELAEAVRRFLASLAETERSVFLSRYWYCESVKDIARRFGFTESKTAAMLHRTRQKLRAALEQEGML